MKVVINKCFGGFGLSDMAAGLYLEALEMEEVLAWEIPRDDHVLVRIVEELGKKSWGPYAELKIVEVPDDVEWIIEDYDGVEWVAEVHETWR
jgi:hypothetical protein